MGQVKTHYFAANQPNIYIKTIYKNKYHISEIYLSTIHVAIHHFHTLQLAAQTETINPSSLGGKLEGQKKYTLQRSTPLAQIARRQHPFHQTLIYSDTGKAVAPANSESPTTYLPLATSYINNNHLFDELLQPQHSHKQRRNSSP